MIRILGSENFPADAAKTVIALGNFDGVHLGHRHLIERTRDEARRTMGASVVYTFDPHPVKVLAPAECPPLLQTLSQKLDSIESLGVDFCVVEKFTAELASHDAEYFFKNFIVARLRAGTVVVGYDFTFGLHRQGTIERLEKFGADHGVKIIVVEAQFLGETLISSTNIRHLAERGDVKAASDLLGRPYCIEGKVVSGRGIGRLLSAHTANIECKNELIPKDGVYLTKTTVFTDTAPGPFPSLTSIGTNPTFPGSAHAIETHLIDMSAELIGRKVRVEFLDRLRNQIAFDSAEELKEQIQRDLETARKAL